MPEQTLKGKVLRSFYYGGQPLKVGTIVDLPRVFAIEMKAANKLALEDPKKEEPPAAAPPKEKANAVK